MCQRPLLLEAVILHSAFMHSCRKRFVDTLRVCFQYFLEVNHDEPSELEQGLRPEGWTWTLACR
jgi:hypothetical protein